jgi:hypothetical protein
MWARWSGRRLSLIPVPLRRALGPGTSAAGRPGVSGSTACQTAIPPRPQAAQVERRAPAGASPRRSRSLPSWSVPWSTTPNTRGFAPRKRFAASRTALRLRSGAADGHTAAYRNSSKGQVPITPQAAGVRAHPPRPRVAALRRDPYAGRPPAISSGPVLPRASRSAASHPRSHP